MLMRGTDFLICSCRMHDFRETGLVFHWMNEYMIPSSEFCTDMQKTRHQEKPIVIEKLVGLFFIMLTGALVSAAVVGFEKLFSRYRTSTVVQFQYENEKCDITSQCARLPIRENLPRRTFKVSQPIEMVSEA